MEPQYTEIGKNTLLVNHGGYGTTPECLQAKFKIGNCVRIRRHKARQVPQEAYVAIIVPPGFPAEYALADAKKQPRPLIITRESRAIQYIVAFADNPTPHLFKESDLMPSDKPDVVPQFGDMPATTPSAPKNGEV